MLQGKYQRNQCADLFMRYPDQSGASTPISLSLRLHSVQHYLTKIFHLPEILQLQASPRGSVSSRMLPGKR